MDSTSKSPYEDLGVRTFINARGTITTMGGSIMPVEVTDAMVAASRHFVMLDELHEKAGAHIASLTGAEAAFVCAGAASGMLLSGAACLTGPDAAAVEALPDHGGRPNEFVISLVDSHYYIHQGFRVCGGVVRPAGTESGVTMEHYEAAICERTAAVVFFLGSQPKAELPKIIDIAHGARVPVIVDAAAQLPPRSNLRELTEMGADLVCFSGGKGLCGPQSTGLILGSRDLVAACALNSNPNSAIGRGMKVGKEEIAGVVKAVELFMEKDEEAQIAEWERRCQLIGKMAAEFPGIRFEYDPPYTQKFPPAVPITHLRFDSKAKLSAAQVSSKLESGSPSILAGSGDKRVSFSPQTLQCGEAETIADRLREILSTS